MIDQFCNDLFQVTAFIKYTNDKNNFLEGVIQKEKFLHVSREAIDVVQSFTNYRFTVEEGKEDANMCQALDELIADGRAEGKATVLRQLLAAGMDEEELKHMLAVSSEELDKMLQRTPVEA